MVVRAFRSWMGGIDEATETWRGPVTVGVGTAIALWVVWYFTKASCTMENAREGLCNASNLANFINHQIMAQCLALGLGSATLKGGYNAIMLSRERKRADAAEQRLEEERKRSTQQVEEERKRSTQQVEDERKRIDAMLEEHRAERQVMLSTMAEISNTLARLLARQQNGRSSPEN